MSQIQKLLLIAHPDRHDTPALQRATALAGQCGASLHVIACVEPFATSVCWPRKYKTMRARTC